MPAPAILMACVVRAAAKHVGNFFTFGLAGDILVDAWDAWQRRTDEAARKKEVEALAAASHAEAQEVARLVVAELRGLSPEDGDRLVEVLAHAPAAIRRSLRGSADPSGRTMPPGRRLMGKDDLRALMPLAPMRFKPGDRPLPGVDWELVELLGVGGFGEVWKARNHHVPTMTPVVLKFCLDAEARKRLLTHEARIIGRVQAQGNLPGIVPLLRSYLSAEPPCLEFEYVDGGDLTALIRERPGGVPSLEVARLIQGLATTIGQAHRLRPPVVHRDLKPSNVLFRLLPNGKLSPCIADFGIGGLAVRQATHQTRRNSESPDRTMTMEGSYTPLYASPQQMAGETADPRDDVYSLGVVWYQALTGDLNKGAPTGDAWKARLRARGLSAELVVVLAACLEHEREDRPANGDDVAARIGRVIAPVRPAVVEPIYAPVVRGKGLDRRQILKIAAGVAGVATAIGVSWWNTKPRQQPDSPKPIAATSTPLFSPEPKNWPTGLAKPLVNSIGMRFARIPAEKFMRGSPKTDTQGSAEERPRIEIEISKAFGMGIYEVTQGEYRRVMDASPSHFKGDFLPVEMVSYKDAEEFCRKLSALPEEKQAGRVYRLPTEAEWEYACRATFYSPYYFGDWLSPGQANFNSKIGKTTDVGSYPPNAFGLYDMHGNVWEWCSDWYDSGYYGKGDIKDPQGPQFGNSRVRRGGSYTISGANDCRAARRDRDSPADIGLCRVLLLLG